MITKVFIPCAGTGSRLGKKTTFLNKALVSVGLRPAISYLIDKIPESMPVVVALGYKGDTLKEFLEIAYPNRKFEFIWVTPFDGPGSGLGRSTLAAEKNLQCPFLFWTCDTLFKEPLPDLANDENWIGCHDLPKNRDMNEFRCVATKTEANGVQKVTGVYDKGQHQPGQQPYVGLLFIKDFKNFFTSLKEGGQDAIDQGEAYGVAKMIEKGDVFYKKEMQSWYDTGALVGLKEANEIFLSEEPAVILEKQNEAIWFLKDMVIKFSDDPTFIQKRVERAKILKDFIPSLISSTKHLYAYRKVQGDVLSRNPSAAEFENLLKWLKSFWTEFSLPDSQKAEFTQACDNFYRTKTLQRVQKFHQLYPSFPYEAKINGRLIPSTEKLLASVPWDLLAQGLPVRNHGDLHFENILRVSDERKFVLLDWRQDFAGLDQYGDIYYDLAKLNHVFIVDQQSIEQGHYKLEITKDSVRFEIQKIPELAACQRKLEDFVAEEKLDQRKINLLTALIFLNSAPLHTEHYAKLIHSLGREMLFRELGQIDAR